jgi:hypothetical protein
LTKTGPFFVGFQNYKTQFPVDMPNPGELKRYALSAKWFYMATYRTVDAFLHSDVEQTPKIWEVSAIMSAMSSHSVCAPLLSIGQVI